MRSVRVGTLTQQSLETGGGGFALDSDANLFAHWTFDTAYMQWASTGAEARDRSGNNNHGAVNGMTEAGNVVAGKWGNALYFQLAYVRANATLSTRNCTLSCWHKTLSTGQTRVLIASGNGGVSNQYVQIRHSSFLEIHVRTGTDERSVASSLNPTDGTWRHIAMTVGASAAYLYADGTQIATMDLSTFGTPTTGNIAAGSRVNGTSTLVQATLDDVRFYSRVLSATEVGDLYSYSGPS